MKNNRFLLTWCWLLLALLLPAITTHAQAVAPNYMSYQGYLTDGSGTPLGNTSPQAYSVVFRIFNSGSGGNPLYSELQTVTADKGNFSILLGQGVRYNSEPFGALNTVFASSPTYIEMTILGIGNGGGSVTLAPRLQLVSTPYAFSANTANQVVNASGTSLLNSTINGMNLVAPVGINTSTPRGFLDFGGNTYVGVNGTVESGLNQSYNGMIEQSYTAANNNDRYGLAQLSGNTTLYTSQTYGSSGIQFGQMTGPTSFNAQMLIAHNGNVGIGSTTPWAMLELGNGANSGGSTSQGQMTFAWNSGGYRHWVQSRHTGAANSAGNAIDFYLNNSTSPSGSGAPSIGNVLGLSITAAGVGVNNQNPGYSLDVNGSEHVAGTSVHDGAATFNSTVYSAGYFISAGGYFTTAIPKVNQQGTYLGWNHNNGDGGTWLVNQKGSGGGGFNFCESDVNNNYTTRMVIAGGTGWVGIGTASPTCPLHVEGWGSRSISGYSYLSQTSGGFPNGFNTGYTSGSSGSPAVGYSIYASGRIACNSEIDCVSDERVKEVVGRSDTAKDLATVRQLQITDYRKVDKVEFGGRLEKGVLAQEVEKIIPEAVCTSTNFIPNIYAPAKAFACAGETLLVTMAQPHGLVVGDVVKLITDTDILKAPVTAVKSAKEFTVSQASFKSQHLFVFGKQVGDFREVNYDRLFTTGLGAIQELDKRLAKVQEREAHLAETEAKAAEQARQENASEIAELKEIVGKLAKEVNSLKLAATERNQAAQQQTATARLER